MHTFGIRSRTIDLFFSRGASRGRHQRTRRNRCPDSDSIARSGFRAPDIINEAHIQLIENEYQLLKLGPRFIYDDPKTASRRRTNELATLQRKIERRFFSKES